MLYDDTAVAFADDAAKDGDADNADIPSPYKHQDKQCDEY